MKRPGQLLLALTLASIAAGAAAQASAQQAAPAAPSPVSTGGTLVIVPAYAEVRHANDEAQAVFMIEEQDRDKAAAASRVNQKMKQGADIVRREDPQAILQTRGYYTYPVYPEDQPPRPLAGKPRQPTGWRVGQYLEVKTTNIAALPKTVAAAQRVLALSGLQFGLSEAASKRLDARRIEATYRNLSERIVAVARAMGRNPADAVLDTVDFEASGAYAQRDQAAPAIASLGAARMKEATPVEEPSFEPGETALQMQVVGKVRFK